MKMTTTKDNSIVKNKNSFRDWFLSNISLWCN